jgi:hypothetical protein
MNAAKPSGDGLSKPSNDQRMATTSSRPGSCPTHTRGLDAPRRLCARTFHENGHGIRPRLAALATCAIVGAALTGAGSPSSAKAVETTTGRVTKTPSTRRKPETQTAEYERAMRTLGEKLSASLQLAYEIEVTSAGTKKAASKDAIALENARVALRETAIQLRRIVPPRRARSAQTLMVKGVIEYAEELGGVIVALDAGEDPVAVLPRILDFKGVKDMQNASLELERKGYNIVG